MSLASKANSRHIRKLRGRERVMEVGVLPSELA